MIDRPIRDIAKADVDRLIENKVHEERTIEYKEALPGSADKDKREFLADVSSFANAAGGDLLYGVKADKGVPTEAIGCKFDERDVLRLESVIRDCVQPRILGMQMVPISGFPQGSVLLVHVPASWYGPHMVTFDKWTRFYTRSSAGKSRMDITEIRAAFLGSEALPEKIRQFRLERIGRIAADETPVRLVPEGKNGSAHGAFGFVLREPAVVDTGEWTRDRPLPYGRRWLQ